jgi:hypothetical protein
MKVNYPYLSRPLTVSQAYIVQGRAPYDFHRNARITKHVILRCVRKQIRYIGRAGSLVNSILVLLLFRPRRTTLHRSTSDLSSTPSKSIINRNSLPRLFFMVRNVRQPLLKQPQMITGPWGTVAEATHVSPHVVFLITSPRTTSSQNHKAKHAHTPLTNKSSS